MRQTGERHAGTGWPQGLSLIYEAISDEDERELIGLIDQLDLSVPTYEGENQRRRTSYGWEFDQGSKRWIECAPRPRAFDAVAAVAARCAGVPFEALDYCLFNRYEAGANIPPHVDTPEWEIVIGVSLGAPGTMTLARERDGAREAVDVELPPRSIYILDGDARHDFTHGMAPQGDARYSITFRTISEEGRRTMIRAA